MSKRIKKSILEKLKNEYANMDGRHSLKEFPQNWMQGRVSDYHTNLKHKERVDNDGTNFDKEHSGQNDL